MTCHLLSSSGSPTLIDDEGVVAWERSMDNHVYESMASVLSPESYAHVTVSDIRLQSELTTTTMEFVTVPATS